MPGVMLEPPVAAEAVGEGVEDIFPRYSGVDHSMIVFRPGRSIDLVVAYYFANARYLISNCSK